MTIPIHEAARSVGISSATLRRWERTGVLPFRPQRDVTGRRVFSDAELTLVRELLRKRHPAASANRS